MTSIAQAEDLKLSVSFSGTLVANANKGDNRQKKIQNESGKTMNKPFDVLLTVEYRETAV